VRIRHLPLRLPATPPSKAKDALIESVHTSVAWPWTPEETERGDLIILNVVTGQTHPLQTSAPPSEEIPEYQGRYEALSYTWGDAGISEFCQIKDDQDNDMGMWGLRPSLASALRYLRCSNQERVFLIDAMCINQEDIEERNEQVKRMTNIYKLAQRVIAWLGEESTNSKNALTALQHVGWQLESTMSGKIVAVLDATEPHLWRSSHPLSFDQQTW
jgi:hypothetical protein